MNHDRLQRQMAFILEIDRLKRELRQSLLTDGSRRENSAEHSWHVALMALVLEEHARESGLDLFRVVKMLLLHDLVEIDAGDTYLFDEEAAQDKAERETRAADRIFSLLPAGQGGELRGLWEEFEAGLSAEARFATSLDRLQPLFHNYQTGGRVWQEHGITRTRVVEKLRHMEAGSPVLWGYAQALIDDAVKKGYLTP
jgi:putative hydrolase of HD superfamily